MAGRGGLGLVLIMALVIEAMEMRDPTPDPPPLPLHWQPLPSKVKISRWDPVKEKNEKLRKDWTRVNHADEHREILAKAQLIEKRKRGQLIRARQGLGSMLDIEDLEKDSKIVDPMVWVDPEQNDGPIGPMEHLDPQDIFYHPPITNEDELAVWMSIAELQARSERRQRELDMRVVVAAKSGNVSLAVTVYHQGASVDAKDRMGVPALIWAVQRGRREMVHWLLHNGADVDARDEQGMTALMTAAGKGDEWMMRILAEYGARGDWVAKRGVSCFSAAAKGRHRQAEEKLLRWFGKDVRDSIETKLLLRRALQMAVKEGDGAAAASLRTQLKSAISNSAADGRALALQAFFRGQRRTSQQPPPPAFDDRACLQVEAGERDLCSGSTLTACDTSASLQQRAGKQPEQDSQALAVSGQQDSQALVVSGLAGSGELAVRWPEPEARPGVYQRPVEFRKRGEVAKEVLAKRRREEMHTLRRLGGLEGIHFEIKRRTRGKDGFKRDDTGMEIEIGEETVVSGSGLRRRVPGPGEFEALGADHGLRIDEGSREVRMALEAKSVEKETDELDWGIPEGQATRQAAHEPGAGARPGERVAELQASLARAQGEGDVHMAMVLTRKLKVAMAKCGG